MRVSGIGPFAARCFIFQDAREHEPQKKKKKKNTPFFEAITRTLEVVQFNEAFHAMCSSSSVKRAHVDQRPLIRTLDAWILVGTQRIAA